MICLGAFCPLWPVVWAESSRVSRHDPSQAISPWFVESVFVAEVLNLRVGKGKALSKNRDDGECMQDWKFRSSVVGLSMLIGVSKKIDIMSEGSVRMFVYVSPNKPVLLTPDSSGSHRHCTQQESSIQRNLYESNQNSTERRP